MTAWIGSSGHIDVLVHALAQYGVIAPDLGADGFRELGQKLWPENHKSVNHSYCEATRTPRYQLRTTEAALDPIVVLKAWPASTTRAASTRAGLTATPTTS